MSVKLRPRLKESKRSKRKKRGSWQSRWRRKERGEKLKKPRRERRRELISELKLRPNSLLRVLQTQILVLKKS